MDKKELREKLIAYEGYLYENGVRGASNFPHVRELRVDFFLSTLPSGEQQQGRFQMPTDKQLIEIAMIFNEKENVVSHEEMADMVAMAEFILHRLHEHGNVSTPSSLEIQDKTNK